MLPEQSSFSGHCLYFTALALQWHIRTWLKEAFINSRFCSLLFQWLNRASFSWPRGKQKSALTTTQGLFKSSLIHVPPKSVMCISLVHLQTGQMSCVSLRFIMFYPWQAWNWNGNSLLRTLKTEEAINSMLRVLATRKSSTRYNQAWGHTHWKEFEPYQLVQMWQNHFHIASRNGNRDIIYFILHRNIPVRDFTMLLWILL